MKSTINEATVTRRKSWLLAGMLCLSATSAMARDVTYFLSDPSGTPLATVDTTGTVTSVRDHRPFGEAALGQTEPGQIGFKGSVEDSDAGFIYMAARFYDPNSGRFLSVDPVSPTPGAVFGFSPYSYANNNPISLSDPKGLYTCRIENHDECVAMVEAAKKYIKEAERQLSAGAKRSSMRSLLAAIGTNGGVGSRGEQISFGFGSLGPNHFGATDYPAKNSFVVTIDRSEQNAHFGSDGNQYSVAVEKAATIVHEVEHVVDAMDGHWQGRGFPNALLRESSAFQTQAFFNEGLRMRSHFLLFNPDLPSADQEKFSKQAIYERATDDAKDACSTNKC